MQREKGWHRRLHPGGGGKQAHCRTCLLPELAVCFVWAHRLGGALLPPPRSSPRRSPHDIFALRACATEPTEPCCSQDRAHCPARPTPSRGPPCLPPELTAQRHHTCRPQPKLAILCVTGSGWTSTAPARPLSELTGPSPPC